VTIDDNADARNAQNPQTKGNEQTRKETSQHRKEKATTGKALRKKKKEKQREMEKDST